MKLKELDGWYKDNEIALDDFMRSSGKNWGSLSYERKKDIYDEYLIQSEKESKRDSTVSRNYHKQPEVIDYFVRNRLYNDHHNYTEEYRSNRIKERNLDAQLSPSERERFHY